MSGLPDGSAAAQARADACDRVLARLSEARVEQLRLAWADVHGTLRGKTVVGGAEAYAAALHDGIGVVSTLLLKDSSDRTAFKVFEAGTDPAMQALARHEGFGSANNLLLRPDPESLQLLPWADGTAWLRCDPQWPDGRAVQADARGVLQRALAALQAAGYGLRCGLEVEFHIHRITDDKLAVADADWPAEPPTVRGLHPGYALLSESHADLAHEALAIVRRTVLGLGLPLRSLEIELGPSQFEVVFAPTDALTAADHMILLRNGLRQALRRAGYHASFVCRPPLPQAVASGWHLHQSLVDLQGRNAFVQDTPAAAAGDARHTLSEAGAQWLAGLLVHAPAMAALCASSIPAYSRYQGSVMAPQAAVWARDNRGAMLRVLGAAGDPATRIENRLGEPSANPYLVMAAQIHAGLDGMKRNLVPPPATERPYAAEASRAAPLPQSLAEALDALVADRVLQEGLGPAMALVYDRIKRQEVARHAQAEDRALWERREYYGRY